MPKHYRHSLVAWIAALLVAALLAGCAGMARKPSAAQQQRAAQAQSLYRAGQLEDAARIWQSLAAGNRGMRATWLLRAAQAYRQAGDWSQVVPLLANIDRDRLQGENLQRFDLLRAESALQQGDAQSTLTATQAMTAYPPALQPRVLELTARAQKALGQPLAAARTRLQLDAYLSGFDKNQNETELTSLLGEVDTATLQQRTREMPDADPLRPWLAQALSHRGLAAATTLPQLNRPVGTMLPGPGQTPLREGYQPPHAIALLLPISGPLAAAAQAVHEGFDTAEHADPKRAATTTVNVFDTGGTPTGALAAYQQAVAQGVDIVVGPLSRDAVGMLFQQTLQVPLLALNHPDNGVPPPGSAEFALPPEADGAQAAARMRAQGLNFAIVFAGQGDSEQRAAHAFDAQFEAMGGKLLGSATISPAQVNYADQITALAALIDTSHSTQTPATIALNPACADLATDPDVADKPECQPNPYAGSHTGVFLALRPREGRLLVPQLNIANLRVPTFATSHIYGMRSDQGLDRDLDNVQFCAAPWLFGAQPGLPLRSKLTATMPDTVGPAARLFAFGMDAWSLLPYLDWMRSHPGSYLAGATGQLTMDSFGRVRRTPIWAHFVNGIAVPMTGALDASNAGAP